MSSDHLSSDPGSFTTTPLHVALPLLISLPNDDRATSTTSSLPHSHVGVLSPLQDGPRAPCRLRINDYYFLTIFPHLATQFCLYYALGYLHICKGVFTT